MYQMCAGNSKWISHRPENKSASWNNKINRFLYSENKSAAWDKKINRFLHSLLPTINSGKELISNETIRLPSEKKTTDSNYKSGDRTLTFKSWRKAFTD